ncbi:MAG: ChaN family lipoprotein [Phycisphaerales bacterium]
MVCLLLGVLGGGVGGCSIGSEQRIAPERVPRVRHAIAWDSGLADATGTMERRRADPAWSALVEEASRADVVLIGEVHGHEPGLAAAAALFEDVVALRGRSEPALALEFLERDDQVAIDDYLTGVIDEDEFRTRTRRTDSNYKGHREMVEVARGAGLAVRGANAPRRYVRLARLQGADAFEGFTPEQRRLVVNPERMADGGYARRFGEVMSAMGRGHEEDGEAGEGEDRADPLDDPMIAGFFRSQNVWDATMADTAVDLVRGGAGPVVLVVGQFHTDFDGGLTRRVRGRLHGADVLVVSMVSEPWGAPGVVREADAGRADAVVYTGALAGE